MSKNVPAHWVLLCVVASLIVSVIACGSVAGQPFFSEIDIISPSNTTYSSNLPPLVVNVTRLGGSNIYVFMNYSIDGQSNQTIPLTTQYPRGSFMIVGHTGSVDLPSLPEGSHSITVYAEHVYPIPDSLLTNSSEFYSKTIYFNITASTQTTPSQTPMPSSTTSITYIPPTSPSTTPTLSPTPTTPSSPASTQNSSSTPNTSTSNSPSPTPSAPELTTIAALIAIAATSFIIVAIIFKRKTQTSQQ